MDSMRGTRTFEQCKRDLKIPLCVGLSGIGKTRFARIAVTHLVGEATGFTSPTMKQMLEKSIEVAKDIWGDDRDHDGLLRELISSSFQDVCIPEEDFYTSSIAPLQRR